MIRPALAACALLLAAPAAAQAPLGVIEGTLALEDVRWQLTSRGEAPSSGWRRAEGELDVTLVGRPRPGSEDLSGALVIRFTLEGGPEPYEVAALSVRHHPEDGGPAWSADAANMDLALAAVSLADDTLTLAGDLAGRLVEGGADSLVTEDGEAVMRLDASFQAALPRLD